LFQGVYLHERGTNTKELEEIVDKLIKILHKMEERKQQLGAASQQMYVLIGVST